MQGGGEGGGELGEVGDEGTGLFDGAVLAEGDEIVAAAVQKRAEARGVAGQTVVGRDGEDDRALVAQVGLGGEGDRAVGDAGGELGERIAGAGGDDEHVEELFGADGLRLFDGMDDGAAAEGLEPGAEVRSRAEAGVGRVGGLRLDGDEVILFAVERGKGVQHAGEGTERAAHGEPDGLAVHGHSSRSSSRKIARRMTAAAASGA